MGKLNKITSALLSVIMVIGIFSAIPFVASAATSGSYEYSVNSDNTAKITKYIDNGSKTVTIPSSITNIGEFAFRGCTGLTSVTIPSTVTQIGNYAFGYIYSNNYSVKIDGFTVYGTKGTAAEKYAYSNGFNFVEGVAAVDPTEVKLNQSSLTLGVGDSYILVSTVLPSDANNKICTWYTSNGSVATVGSTGKVTAKAVGTAVITAKTVNGKTATCKVTVKPAPTGVKISPTALTLGKGESYVLKSTVSPTDAKNKTCTWSTNNSSIAIVSSTGKVTAKAVGTAVITAKTVNGKTATCKVTVKPAPTSVKTSPTTLTLGKGESYTIKESTSSGSYANNANLKWTSTNTNVVTVKKGSGNAAVLKATGQGTANVKITLYNGKTATCKVTVKPAPTSVKINPTSLTLGKGEGYTISASTSSGSYANNANIKWTSTNTKVVTVKKGSGNKAELKAVGKGTANVKITLYNGKTATCKVTVKPAPTSVKVSPSSVTLDVGKSYTVSEITNSGSYANAANLKWTSTNTKVVTVKKGSGNKAVLKAVGTGTANVKITLFNGKTATCKVTVNCSDINSAKTEKDYYTLSYKVYEIVNQERIKAGVKPLRFNDKVNKAAMKRANECHKYFSHTRPNGKDCFTVFSEFGIKQSYAGENIALGYSAPKYVMEGWMQSKGHRDNILNPVFTDFGCGVCSTGEWTQLFCRI